MLNWMLKLLKRRSERRRQRMWNWRKRRTHENRNKLSVIDLFVAFVKRTIL
jgi:hypothetical protein